MNNRRGFSIIEMMIIIGIFGILSAVTIIKYQDSIAASTLEKTANSLYLDLRSLRPLAFKYDSWVYGKFFADKCSVYVDTNGTKTRDGNDIRKVILIPSPVTIGLPSTAPTAWPYPGWTTPTNGMTQNWTTLLDIEPDSRGEYCHGGIYLKSSKIPKTAYFIGIDTAMQSLELFKWEGTSWQKR